MTFRVFGDSRSGNCYKVHLLLHHLGLPHEWVEVDIMKKASRTPAFLRMNPGGQVPVLETAPGVFLPQSNAILHYLAEGSAFLPQDRMERAQVLQWMFFEQNTHEPRVAQARFIVRYLGRPPELAERLRKLVVTGYEALDLMEAHLARRAFLVADRCTIADTALYAYTHVAHEGDFDLARFPAIRSWLDRVKAQPGHIGMDA